MIAGSHIGDGNRAADPSEDGLFPLSGDLVLGSSGPTQPWLAPGYGRRRLMRSRVLI